MPRLFACPIRLMAKAFAPVMVLWATGAGLVAQEGIDPLSAPDWLPPLRPPTDGEPSPPLPEVVPGLVILPEKEVAPGSPLDPSSPGADGGGDTPAPEVPHWHTNPKKARDVAGSEGKYHIMALLGVDWSTNPNPSRLLAVEVLNTASFSRKVANDFVLSYVDFPQNKNKWSDTHKKLKDYYGVKGFPALVLFDSAGKQIGKISGYKLTAEADERKFLFAVEFDQLIKADREAKRREAERRAALAGDGYRDWESGKGSILFAKLVRASDKIAEFKDEENQLRRVALDQLDIADRTLIRRMVEARHVPPVTAQR